MTLVSYADDLITVGSHDEQSLGASILVALAESDRFADATLRRICVSAPTIERLIEMLSWKGASERDVRRSAAVVVSMLTERKLILLRVTGIPGAIESVASLLYADLDELNILGLSILNKLAHDHDNCDKIGKTRGLLDKIISYSSIDHALAASTPRDMRIKAVKQSLRVRRDKNVQLELHQMAIEILTSLAMDDVAREIIGETGGVVSVLVAMFLPAGFTTKECRTTDAVRVEAGEALAMLAIENKKNRGEIIMALGGGVWRLVGALKDPTIIVSAARIMRNLCSYAGDEWQIPLRGVTAGAAKVLRSITVEKAKILSIFIGLAAQMLPYMEPGGTPRRGLGRGEARDGERAEVRGGDHLAAGVLQRLLRERRAQPPRNQRPLPRHVGIGADEQGPELSPKTTIYTCTLRAPALFVFLLHYGLLC
uniref:Uncharacterized protein n=1 Tax=Aegilops tauschii TaxID=37682 RepID=N1QPQ3_AEGTA